RGVHWWLLSHILALCPVRQGETCAVLGSLDPRRGLRVASRKPSADAGIETPITPQISLIRPLDLPPRKLDHSKLQSSAFWSKRKEDRCARADSQRSRLLLPSRSTRQGRARASSAGDSGSATRRSTTGSASTAVFPSVRRAGSRRSRKRTAGSRSSWRTRCWTTRRSRMCSQKTGKAHHSASGGCLSARAVGAVRASCLQGRRRQPLQHPPRTTGTRRGALTTEAA